MPGMWLLHDISYIMLEKKGADVAMNSPDVEAYIACELINLTYILFITNIFHYHLRKRGSVFH